ncbi:TPA: UDP-glucose 6-dehydrogenase [Candidatus Dependentiae bacterium]|nr:MAG: Nucleotide sugar dehydrogenase [candidate division TM6 bacterium GW2011_GWE2_31_21]KKP53928.1 MAG: Nucleotide sugar dehydrogenase [candidate division TM6 bacterium GW2011_GWF2_33_332]HBS47708.1 UDP-glucose 6-dehydrogenase [Candidatus Dependentiae bacterium]HBZ73857.1 UDP-glucose 6-dehydrogenase [Candidatus Dependentiae bacterium]
MKKIAVVGAGYVGLVTGACFAHKGEDVTIVENNESKIQSLLAGKIPFYEPGLDLIVKESLENQKLKFVKSVDEALKKRPDIIFICVGTPTSDVGIPDLSYVYAVAKEVGQNINDYCLIVDKSTVPVGTAKEVKEIINQELARRKLSVDFDVASNPEFLKEGSAVLDFLEPDRVVVGVESEKAEVNLRDLYKKFCTSSEQFMVMKIESAELTKYASNAMLATRISFINQLALLADTAGADIEEIKRGMGKDKRIGSAFLNAGIGYGGSCFPKDLRALVYMGEKHKQLMTLAKEVENINKRQRIAFLEKIEKHYGQSLKDKKVGIWGLAFKPETDDIRCAPSLDIIPALLEIGCKIFAYDPIAAENIKNIYGEKINFANTANDVLANSDFLIILTEWNEFLKFKPQDFCILSDKIVFDGRNCFDPISMAMAGIDYFTVGRDCLSRDYFNVNCCQSKKSECEI